MTEPSSSRAPQLLAVVLLAACGAAGPPLCVTGSTNACTCNDGRAGSQVCAGGAYGACSCTPVLPACTSGQTVGCTCGGGIPGERVCDAGGVYGSCSCPAPDRVCSAGAKRACTCADDTAGEQLCGPSSRWLDCICPSSKRIFVTTTVYNGNLGGLAGADLKCTTAAQAVNLPGTFKAWLSSTTVNAIDRIEDVGPWFFPGVPVKVFNNKANLTTVPLQPIAVNERGDVLSTGTVSVWTGTRVGGERGEMFNASRLCDDWMRAQASGVYSWSGGADQTGNGWTVTDTSANCLSQFRLYCLQQ